MDGAVSEAELNIFCGGKSGDFLPFPRLLSKLLLLSKVRGVYHASNVKQLLYCHIKLKKRVARSSFLGG